MKQLQLIINQKIDYTHLLKTLIELNYIKAELVFQRGDYTLRGAIIDIFPSNSSHPIRIELNDQTIERICSFNSQDQCMLNHLKKINILQFDPNKKSPAPLPIPEKLLPSKINNFQENDYIVHENHGIGIYKGFKRLKINDQEEDFIFLKYKGNDKVYVPINQINLIHRYSESKEAQAKLTALTNGNWQKITRKAHEETEKLAQKIVELYKIRKNKKGIQ